MVWTSYKEKVKAISDRIVEAQKPIRILDSIKWDPETEAQFRKSKYKDVPKVDAAYYAKLELGYDPTRKIEELQAIRIDNQREVGKDDSIGKLLTTIIDEYIDVVKMIQARGTKEF